MPGTKGRSSTRRTGAGPGRSSSRIAATSCSLQCSPRRLPIASSETTKALRRDRGAAPTTVIIAIAGPIGVGKSTVARQLAAALGYRYISGGEVFREIARERGISVTEVNKLRSEEHTSELQSLAYLVC